MASAAVSADIASCSAVKHNYNIFLGVSISANVSISSLVSMRKMYSLTCFFDLFLQISDPRTVMTFPGHFHLTKAARLSSAKTSTATL